MVNRAVEEFVAGERRVVEHVTKTVNVYAAPTDASVKMYNELKTAAEKSILETVRIQDINFDCVVHMSKSFVNATTDYKAICTVNGVRVVAVHCSDPERESVVDAYTVLMYALSREMAKLVLAPAFTKTLGDTASHSFSK
jgi:hypothetical protein